MISYDLLLTIGSVILTITMIPTIANKKSAVPFWGSFPTALVLFPYFVILFWLLGTPMMSVTLAFEGLAWWFIVFRRRVKKSNVYADPKKLLASVWAKDVDEIIAKIKLYLSTVAGENMKDYSVPLVISGRCEGLLQVWDWFYKQGMTTQDPAAFVADQPFPQNLSRYVVDGKP